VLVGVAVAVAVGVGVPPVGTTSPGLMPCQYGPVGWPFVPVPTKSVARKLVVTIKYWVPAVKFTVTNCELGCVPENPVAALVNPSAAYGPGRTDKVPVKSSSNATVFVTGSAGLNELAYRRMNVSSALDGVPDVLRLESSNVCGPLFVTVNWNTS
jgi:hypothetical protein